MDFATIHSMYLPLTHQIYLIYHSFTYHLAFIYPSCYVPFIDEIHSLSRSTGEPRGSLMAPEAHPRSYTQAARSRRWPGIAEENHPKPSERGWFNAGLMMVWWDLVSFFVTLVINSDLIGIFFSGFFNWEAGRKSGFAGWFGWFSQRNPESKPRWGSSKHG